MKKIHHVVLLKFKGGTGEATIAALFAALAGLQHTLPGIQHFCGGPYASPEGMNQGFSHAFIMTFRDAEARNLYLDHPAHEKIKAEFLPSIESVVAFDFEE